MIAQADLSSLKVTNVKTSAYAAGSGELVQCDASGGAFTVSLPGSPRVNQIVGVKLLDTTGGNAVTVARNGNAIEGEVGDLALASTGDYAELQFDGAGTWLSRAGLGATGREVLTANRTYYVRTDGSDSNNGLTNTSGGAFLTIQKAIDTTAALDMSIYDVLISVANGTYTTPVNLKACVGSGKVTIRGDVTTPSNVLISTTSSAAIRGVNVVTVYLLEGVKIQTTTSGQGIFMRGNTSYLEVGNVEIGVCATHQIQADSRAFILLTSNYTVSGGSGGHWVCTAGGMIRANLVTVTITGTPAYSLAWAYADQLSAIAAIGNTYSGAATGVPYYLTGLSLLDTGGVNATMPGNGTPQTLFGAVKT